MAHIAERTYRKLFWIGIGIKALISAGELAAGFLFLIFDEARIYALISKLAYLVTGDELTESVRDPFWQYLVHVAKGFLNTPQAVWAFIFLSHGIVKMLLLGGIYKNIKWAYPATAYVFALFVVYQCYQYFLAPSVLLLIITAFDIALIFLITHEYRFRYGRRHE